MGIYIQGLEMPKEGCIEILIHSDGIVQLTGRSVRIEGVDYYTPYIGEKPEMHTAICVPPHGRLIDADALGEFPYNMDFCDGYEADEWVRNATTVIPAEGTPNESNDT